MNKKSASILGIIALTMTMATSILAISADMMVYAQNTSTSATVHSQGNVTSMQNTTGMMSPEQADDKNEVEEGPGEDDDEPGDNDLNDEED